MTDIFADLQQAGEEQKVDLGEITALADKQLQLEGDIDRLEQQLAAKKKELNVVMLDRLPAAMQSVGLKSLVLTSGKTVNLKEEMTISVPAKRKAEIIGKLRSMDLAYLVANSISINFDKGADDQADKTMKFATEQGLEAIRSETVNSASLKKLLNDRRKEGVNDDLSFFGAFVVTKTTIK